MGVRCVQTGARTTACVQRSKGSSVRPVLSSGLYVGSGNWVQVVSLVWQAPIPAEPLCWSSALCSETGSLSLNWSLLTRLGCQAVVQGSSCLQFPRAGMMGACYPAWLVMCAGNLPSSPHTRATGALLTELFYQPLRVLLVVPFYRQGNRGAGILSHLHEIPEVPSDRNPSRVRNSHQDGNGHVKVGRREDCWRVTRWLRGK